MNERSNVNAFACSQEEFKRLIEDERLQQGIIYFVGDSNTIGQGVSLAKKGTIYLATSRNRAVPFIGFTSTDDLQRQINEVKETSEKQLQDLTFNQEELTEKVENLSEKIFKWEWNTPSFDATKVGEYYGILRFKQGEVVKATYSYSNRGVTNSDVVIMSSDSVQNNIISLVGKMCEVSLNEDGYFYLLFPYKKSSREESLHFELSLDYYSGNTEDIIFYDDLPFVYDGELGYKTIIKTPSIRTGATQFEINANPQVWNTFSVYDYIGKLNVELGDTERLVLKNSNSLDLGQIVNLTFTKNVLGGLSVKNWNASKTLCEIEQPIYAGDVLTFTLLSTDEWICSVSRSSIVCEDGTINIEVVGGVTYISAIQQPPQRIELTSEDESVTITETENGFDFSVPSGGGTNIDSSDGSIVITDSPTPNTKDLKLPKDVIRNHSTIQDTNNDETLALGHNAQCRYGGNVALGVDSNAIGSYSTSLGRKSIASGGSSIASGNYSTASGNYSVAIGSGANANQISSVAVGNSSTASGNSSISLGNSSTASGYGAVASGNLSNASGNYSIASGYSSVASGNSSTASGNYSTASGNKSIAIGCSSNASEFLSIAIGNYSTASGNSSISLGNSSTASEFLSIAIGDGAKSSSQKQIVIGCYNEEVAEDKLQIGDGTSSSARHNLAVIDQYERFICKKQVANGVWKYDNQSTSALSFAPSDVNFKGSQTLVISSVQLSGASSFGISLRNKAPIEGETLTILAKNYPLNVYDDNGSIVLIQSGKFAELIYIDGQWYSKQY